jgi:hypothetical protein
MGADIRTATWSGVEPFVAIVNEIKGVKSPVFSSKLCHFLLPPVFPVIDNREMGLPYCSYGEYFSAAQREWSETAGPVQAALRNALEKRIGPGMRSDYPQVAKIVEISLIGRRRLR